MRDILYCVGLLIMVGLVVGYLALHRPRLARNEAKGPVDPRRFTGYKASLETAVNNGTPFYGESIGSAS